MVIRRSDSRRRKVVIQEATSQLEQVPEPAETAAAAPRPKKRRASRDYLPAAQRRHQHKSTDWIPKRRPAVAIFLLALAGCVIALAGMDWFCRSAPSPSTLNEIDGWRQRLSLQGNCSLSVWFSTVLLLISAMASLQIRALRQHRSNDYRGTYRVWMWFAGLLLLASVNCVLDLDGMARSLFGQIGNGQKAAWFLSGVQWIALMAILTRGAIEVRRSPASLAVIVIVWLAYSASLLLRLPGMESRVVQDDGFTAAALNLLATTGVFVSITLYARFVYLRANGLVAATVNASTKKRSKKTASEKTKATESPAAKPRVARTPRSGKRKVADEATMENGTVSESVKSAVKETPFESRQAAPVRPTATEAPRPTVTASPEQNQDEEADLDSGDERNQIRTLSKAERKRLKKQQRQQGSTQDRRAA